MKQKKPKKPLPPGCRACRNTGLYYDENAKPELGVRHCSCPLGVFRSQEWRRHQYLTEAR